jgi:hypothetical protein
MKLKHAISMLALAITTASQANDETTVVAVGDTSQFDSVTKRKRINIVNDYQVLQAINYDHIKNNQSDGHLTNLARDLDHYVMDLISSLPTDQFGIGLVIRPIEGRLTNMAYQQAGKTLVESVLADHFKAYGFEVFNGRRPKGKFEGNELVFEGSLRMHGEQLLLDGNLRELSSNKIAATGQVVVIDHFFKRREDGVEVLSER